MHQPLSTEKMKYYQLMALVCEDLPTKVNDALVRAGHEATSEELRAVRQGRKINLLWLIDMVRKGLPDYSIPAELLPVVPVEVATPLMLGL